MALWQVSTALALHIVGGNTTAAHPSVVAFGGFNGPNGQIVCTGTMVAKRWMLTAAHCITDAELLKSNGWSVYVFTGNDLTSGGTGDNAELLETHVHPDWSSAIDYPLDLALVRLSQALGEPVSPREDPLTASDLGSEVEFVGYGWTLDGRGDAGVKGTVNLALEQLFEGGAVAHSEIANCCSVSPAAAGWLALLMPLAIRRR